jgi:hypothetical protein
MNEQYLHLIWKLKRLPFHHIRTVSNEEIDILNVGLYNTDSGPDFFNGKIVMNGIRHHGNIELHVRSSDWYLHKHQQDPAYNSVILHVVYEYDQPVFVQGKELPTIELKPWIDWQHFELFKQNIPVNFQIACSHALFDVPQAIQRTQLDKMGRVRLERKSRELYPENRMDLSLHHLLIRAFAVAFGAKTNALPFRELSHCLPHEKLLKASLQEKTAIIFGIAGFLSEMPQDSYHDQLTFEWRFLKHKLQLRSLRKETWKFKGCLPAGFPTIRLAQFIHFYHHFPWHAAIWMKPVPEQISLIHETLKQSIDNYWYTHYDFGKVRKPSTVMSGGSINGILINSLPLFLWMLSERFNESVFQEAALEMWRMLPAEKNQLIANWNIIGMKPSNAFDSQAILEQIQQVCIKKSCLSCRMGQVLLKNQ